MTCLHCFIYLFLFLAALGLRCCSGAFSGCGEQVLLSSCNAGTLMLLLRSLMASLDGVSCCGAQALGAQASVAVAHSFSSCDLPALGRVGFIVVALQLICWGWWALEPGLSSLGPQTQLLHGMWNLPKPGIEPMTPALAGRFLSTTTREVLIWRRF